MKTYLFILLISSTLILSFVFGTAYALHMIFDIKLSTILLIGIILVFSKKIAEGILFLLGFFFLHVTTFYLKLKKKK